jgi:hypothetical protein
MKLSDKNKARLVVYTGLLVLIAVVAFVRLRTFSIADFTAIDFGMSQAEVVRTIGRPASGWLRVANATASSSIGYNLNCGSRISILLVARTSVVSVRIYDPGGRRFNLQRCVLEPFGYNYNEHQKREAIMLDSGGLLLYSQQHDPDAFAYNEIRIRESLFRIGDFVDIEIGMSHMEVMGLLEVSLEDGYMLGLTGITKVFDLGSGSEMRLYFDEKDELGSIRIIDPIGRIFIMVV